MRKRHRPVTMLRHKGGSYQKCEVCGATRNPQWIYGWYPWKLRGKPMPYCPEYKA